MTQPPLGLSLPANEATHSGPHWADSDRGRDYPVRRRLQASASQRS